MPCPYFLPSPVPGDAHAGNCAGEPAALIPADKLRRYCHRGYARDTCETAATLEADATALLIKSDRDGVVEVAWSLERDHHPLEVGVLRLTNPPEHGSPLELQAGVLVSGYLKRMGRL